MSEADREAAQGAALALPARSSGSSESSESSESGASELPAGRRAWLHLLHVWLPAWRRRFTAFVARHELAWDLSLGGLT